MSEAGRMSVGDRLTGFENSSLGTSTVVVRSGETLRSVAQRIYGDGSLWYVLADANGLTNSDETLAEGQNLQVPQVGTNTNSASTFKPYDPSEQIGPTAPSLPTIAPPPKNSCNPIAQLLMVIVAVVVTIYTAGAASGATGGFANVFGAGISATTGGMGVAGVGYAAIGGAVGSVASQAVGLATGQIDRFSWRSVATSAVGSAIGAGIGSQLGPISEAIKVGDWGTVALSGGLNAMGSYVANKVTGQQTSFSWRSVVAGAVGSVVGGAATNGLGLTTDNLLQNTLRGTIGGLVAAHTGKALGVGGVNEGRIFIDAFGNALGNAFVEKGLGGRFIGPESGRMSKREGIIALDRARASGVDVDSFTANQRQSFLDIAEIQQWQARHGDSAKAIPGWMRERLDANLARAEAATEELYPLSPEARRGYSGDGVFGTLETFGHVAEAGLRGIKSDNPFWQNAVRSAGAIKGFVVNGIGGDVMSMVELATDAAVIGLYIEGGFQDDIGLGRVFGERYTPRAVVGKYSELIESTWNFVRNVTPAQLAFMAAGKATEYMAMHGRSYSPDTPQLGYDWDFGVAMGELSYGLVSLAAGAATGVGAAVKGVASAGRIIRGISGFLRPGSARAAAGLTQAEASAAAEAARRLVANGPQGSFNLAAQSLSSAGRQNIRSLRGWAESKGWVRQSGDGPEVWGVRNADGDFSWRLKIKPEASTRGGLGAGSAQPRFDARLDDRGTYVNPFTGETGGRAVGTHLPLDKSWR